MEILKVQNLCKTYGTGEAKVDALKNVSFSLEKGEFVAVVGESGSGKSTLLNCIGALDVPTSGTVTMDGNNLFSMKEEERTIFRRRNIGFIFQSFQLVSELTVEQNIAFPLLLDYRKPKASDVEEILENGIAYNKLASEDLDALKKGMNRIIYGTDVDPEASKHFKLKPGAYWDVSTDIASDGKQAQIGTIDTDFNYDTRMENTLNRIKSDMHEVLNIPMINNSDLQGMMTSGKSMKALYWQLITRCEEKMMSWRPALEWTIRAILEMNEVYSITTLPKLENFDVVVENQYPLQENEDEEMTLDLQKVNAQTMSRKTFIKKWTNVTDDIAEEELKQIQLEKQMLEDSYAQFETNFEDEE